MLKENFDEILWKFLLTSPSYKNEKATWAGGLINETPTVMELFYV